MTKPKDVKPDLPKKKPKPQLADALRANLKRRKAVANKPKKAEGS